MRISCAASAALLYAKTPVGDGWLAASDAFEEPEPQDLPEPELHEAIRWVKAQSPRWDSAIVLSPKSTAWDAQRLVTGGDDHGVVGYRAKRNTEVLDFGRLDQQWQRFWEPVYRDVDEPRLGEPPADRRDRVEVAHARVEVAVQRHVGPLDRGERDDDAVAHRRPHDPDTVGGPQVGLHLADRRPGVAQLPGRGGEADVLGVDDEIEAVLATIAGEAS